MNYIYNEIYQFTFLDFFYTPFLLFFVYYFAKSIRDKRIEKEPEFRFFLPALTVKIFGAITVVLIYTLYYPGGDTNYYFQDGLVLVRLMTKNFPYFWDIVVNGLDISKFYYFDQDTGYPIYFRQKQTFFVVRIVWPLILLGMKSFICTSILLALVSFGGIWRMYRIFNMEFPSLSRQLAIAFFFVPSVFFWGSGLLKDTITFSAVGYFFHGFYYAFIKKKKLFPNLVAIYLSVAVILSIKPYIFIGLLPGALIWIIRHYTSRIQGTFIRGVTFPTILFVGFLSGYLLLIVLGDELGKYSLDKILQEAATTNFDLKQNYYRGNSFDIGHVDPTINGMLSKTLPALNAALFRPFLWESNNMLMFISALENFLILMFTIFIVVKLRIVGVFKYFNKHHLLTFSLIFSLFFAFSVGISTSNFGSLVRYRIPLIPFYVSSLFIIQYYYRQDQAEKAKAREVAYNAYA